MIGLPGQTIGDLADDILFFRDFDVDMVGMGPYIEHDKTPMYSDRDILMPLMDRFNLSLNMIATLRLVMPDVNMAATTAMQAIDPEGREKAIMAGANIVMPNLTPLKYREQYLLYDGKPCLDEDAIKSNETIIRKIESTGYKIGFNEWGDSKHFLDKHSK
jgi:biotin synthase